jgi:hypothetical protein
MSANAFEKSNLSWQVQQVQQRVSEWLELQFARNLPDLPNVPDWSIPRGLLDAAFWLIVITATLWLGWQAWRGLSAYLTPLSLQQMQALNRQAAPEAQERSIAQWLKQVQEFQQRGNYREACRSLYMAMLQRLHETKLVTHQLSRTDGEYWQALQRSPQSQAYQTLIDTHEQLCFSDTAISAEAFGHCQQAYREIEARSKG